MKKETFLPGLMVLLIAGWVVLSGCGTGGFNEKTPASHSVSLGPISKGEVEISGFGRFCVKNKKERRGRNPSTGDALMLDPRKVVAFKCSGKLRDKVNG